MDRNSTRKGGLPSPPRMPSKPDPDELEVSLEEPVSTPREHRWSSDRDTTNTETDRPSSLGRKPQFIGKAPAINSPEYLEWFSGLVYRIDAESEIRHRFYRSERKNLDALHKAIEAAAKAVHADVASLKEAIGHDERPWPGREGRKLPASGMISDLASVKTDVAALKKDVGEEPDPSVDFAGSGIKARLANILADRRFYRVLLTTASGIVVFLQAVRVIHGMITGH